MSLRHKLSAVRASLQDARTDLEGIQRATSSSAAAAEIAAARAELDDAISCCTDALRHQLEQPAAEPAR